MPVAVAVPAAVIERKAPTLTEVAALTVRSAGVMLAVWEGSATGSVTGVVLGITALLSSAAMVSTTGKVRTQAASWASGRAAAAGGCAVSWCATTGLGHRLGRCASRCRNWTLGQVQQQSAKAAQKHCCPMLIWHSFWDTSPQALRDWVTCNATDARLLSETPTCVCEQVQTQMLLLSPLQVLPSAATCLADPCQPSERLLQALFQPCASLS